MSKISSTLLPSSPPTSMHWVVFWYSMPSERMTPSLAKPWARPNVHTWVLVDAPPMMTARFASQGMTMGATSGGAREVNDKTLYGGEADMRNVCDDSE